MNRVRFSSLLIATFFFGNGLTAAAALQVADGCAAPPATSSGSVHYIDPVHGSTTGDGSALHPWNSLQAINGTVKYAKAAWRLPGCKSSTTPGCTSGPLLATQTYSHIDPVSKKTLTSTNPNAPIKAGDTIFLMNGNYGDIRLDGIVNPSFITITAAPGQAPVLSSLELIGGAKWIIQGLKFRALADDYSPFIQIAGSKFYGAGHDIVIDDNDLASQEDVTAWTRANWVAKARYITIMVDGGDQNSAFAKCVSITNNSITNVRDGIVAEADNMLVDGNTIDNFGDDAIVFAANNLVISHNKITNAHDIGDGNHNDAIQGQTGNGVGGTTVFNNLLIDGNIIIAKTRRALPFPGELQGITAFDMDWSNVGVINNVVITNTYHGLSFYSLHTGLIANNTVLGTAALNTWIGVFPKSHQGSASNNVIVRNNIASVMDLDTPSTTIAIDHNLVGSQIVWYAKGKEQWLTLPGTYGSKNVIDPVGLASIFTKFSILTATYDVHLKAGTLAVGTGNSVAPHDITGKVRTPPVDLGAYEYVPAAGGG